VEDDSEDMVKGIEGEGWWYESVMLVLCRFKMKVIMEGSGGGESVEWIEWVKVFFFILQRTEWEEAPLSEEGEGLFEWRDLYDICCVFSVHFLPRDVR